MRRSLLMPVLLASSLWGATPPAQAQAQAQAQAPAAAALRQAEEGTFRSNDLNGDGRIARREMIVWVDSVFYSTDTDGDERLSPEEWLAWDTGYVHAGRAAGREGAVQDAKRALLAEPDLNGDGAVDQGEMSAAALYAFHRADGDRNGSLGMAEYTTGFLIPRTLRAAAQGVGAGPARGRPPLPGRGGARPGET